MSEASDDAPRADRWSIPDGFDLDAFLGRPLVARVAANGRHGPTVRPLWYLWEEGCFWWLTGSWSKLGGLLDVDPRVALVVDTCDLERGEVLQVTARGSARARAVTIGGSGGRPRRRDARCESGRYRDRQ